MNWDNFLQIVTAVLASFGGGGIIISVFANYLGKIWANIYLEKTKKDFQREIEEYKNELDILKEKALRYSSKQFELYNQLWQILYGLKIAADELWKKANKRNLQNFINRLKNVSNEIEKNSLLIEDNHYIELIDILQKFKDYQIGKKNLIELRQRNKIQNNIDIPDEEIERMIERNRTYKEKYEKLIFQIRKEFKKQLQG